MTRLTNRIGAMAGAGIAAGSLLVGGGVAEASIADLEAAQATHANIIHQWTFNGADIEGHLADQVGGNNLVQLARGTGDVGAITYGPGFDGTSGAYSPQSIARQEGAGLHTQNTVSIPASVTVEAVYRADAHDVSVDSWTNYIVGAREGDAGRAFFLMQGNHGAGTQVIRSVAGDAFGNSADHFAYTPGNWYYSAVTYVTDGTNITVNAWYADLTSGDLTLTKVVNDAVFAGNSNVTAYVGIGNFVNDGLSIQEFLKGAIDNVAIYNGALSEADLQAHVSAVPEPASAALLAALGGALAIRRRGNAS